jgi:Uncharacterized conserved protein
MQSKRERQQYIDLLNREIKPALGCTEPIAVALAVAKAAEILREKRRNRQRLLLRLAPTS